MSMTARPLSVCVFCGARSGVLPAYAAAAQEVGQWLGRQGHRLVYGGGRDGLMGVLSNAALAAGGQVLGIIPERLTQLEHANHDCTTLEVVPNMQVRKARMAAESDAFLILPGGLGTLEELMEMWTLNVLGYHNKPMALLNTAGYYDSWIHFLQQVEEGGFVSRAQRERLRVGTDAVALMQALLQDVAAQSGLAR